MNSTSSYWIGLLYDDWEWSDGGRSAYRDWMTYSKIEGNAAVFLGKTITAAPKENDEDYTLCSKGKLSKRNIVKLLLICMKGCYSILIVAWSRGLNDALPFYSLHLSSQTQCRAIMISCWFRQTIMIYNYY
jgi:hypothetical protein